MMPFSVLRMFGLALFSWLLLGAGIYLAYQSYQRFNAPSLVVESTSVVVTGEVAVERVQSLETEELNRDDGQVADRPARDGGPVIERPAVERQDFDWKRWALLAGAIACLGLSFGGKWSAEWILGNSQGKPFVAIEPSSTHSLDRPDGSKLHVDVFGKLDGPTLILTHGWSLNSSAWNYIATDLAKRFRIVTWDLPGLGQSRGPTRGGFSMEMLAEHLEAVLQTQSSAGPAILIGHSIGGMTQQTFCRLFPQHLGSDVVGMVLVHTTYTNPVRTNFAAALTTAIETPVLVPLNYLMIALSPLAWLSNWQSYFNGSSHWTTRFTSFTGRQTREQLDHSARMGAAAWPATVARGNLAMLRFEARETLPQVQIPVLVIGGENDRMTVCSASDQISQRLPNDRPLHIQGGHLGYWEFADEVIDAIQEFASEQFGRARQMNSTIRSTIPAHESSAGRTSFPP